MNATEAVVDHQCEWSGGERWSIALDVKPHRDPQPRSDGVLLKSLERVYVCKCGFSLVVEYAPATASVLTYPARERVVIEALKRVPLPAHVTEERVRECFAAYLESGGGLTAAIARLKQLAGVRT